MTRWAIWALALAACRDEDTTGPTGDTGTVPEPFVEGPCAVPVDGARCGTVTVPALHGVDDGRTLSLQVEILPATSGAAGEPPLVLFNGGPGSSVFGLIPLYADLGYGAPMAGALNVDRDVVFFSERGTPGAAPALGCPELAEVDAIFDRSEEEKAAAQVAAFTACRARLAAEGVDLDVFDGAQRVFDVPVVLRALGYDRWHVWGVSGGALLVQRLIRDAPDGIVTAMVDSGGFVDLSIADVATDLIQNADARYDQLFADCAADPICGVQYPQFEEQLFELVATLEAAPRTVPVTHPLTGVTADVTLDGDLLLRVFTNNMASVHLLPYLTLLATYGDFTIIDSVLPSAFVSYTGADFADGLYQSVFCADLGDVSIDDIETSGVRTEIAQALLPSVAQVLDTCAVWDVPALDTGGPVSSDTVPLLIMEGRFDTNRDPEQGPLVAAQFAHAAVVEFADRGHVTFSPCAVDLMGQFMADPAQPLDAGCVPTAVPWVPLY